MDPSCHNTSLCIFDKQVTQSDIQKNTEVPYHPINSVSGNVPIEFHVPGAADDYIDLNDINLKVQLKVKKTDGKNIAAANKAALVNLGIASLFADVAVTVGETQIQGGEFDNPYIAYLWTLTQFQQQAQKTHLQLWGWHRDQAGKFDDNSNKAHATRMDYIAGSKVYELYGPLFIGIMRQPRLLISLTDLRIKLTRASQKFALMVFGAEACKVIIESATLYVKRFTVNPSVIEGHASGLEKMNALYPHLYPRLLVHTVNKDSLETLRDNIFPLQMPRSLFIAMVDHEAYSGDFKKNPFNFQHFNLNKLVLYRNGEVVQGRVFEPDYKDDKYADVYAWFMRSLKMYNTDDSNGISYADFKNGYNIYAYDLTPDSEVNAPHRSVSFDKGLRLEMKFKSKLTTNVNVLIFGLFDAMMEVTKTRHVTHTLR